MDEVIKNLESLGFTNYESRVFYVLFKGHLMTATEIAKEANIPRSSSYDILRSFAEKGICNEIQTSSVAKYELIDPKVVEDKIEKEIHSTYSTKISRLKESFDKLQPLFDARDIQNNKIDVELIKGFNKHRHVKFIELLKACEKEMLLMNKLEGYILPELDQTSLDFYTRGGTIRSIYEANLNFKIKVNGAWKNVTPNGLVDICRNFTSQGEQIRLSRNVPQNIAIFDRKIAFISLVDPSIAKHNRSDVIIKNENFAGFMADCFVNEWHKSMTIDDFENSITSSQEEVYGNN